MFAKQNKRDIEGGVVTWLRFATNEIACESRVARRVRKFGNRLPHHDHRQQRLQSALVSRCRQRGFVAS
jgi:hypothetical protein